MSSTFDTGQGGSAGRDARDAINRETQSARDELGSAGTKLREGAQSALSEAKERASATAEEGKSVAASSLQDFAAAIRRASDELGDRDQSMGANLVRQAAGGLEQASDALKGRSIPELAGSVADFARRQPAAFLIGATLAGVALGRFARASSDHDHGHSTNGAYGGNRQGRSYDDRGRYDDRSRDQAAFGNSYTSRSSSMSERFEERDRRAGTAAGTGGSSTGQTTGSSFPSHNSTVYGGSASSNAGTGTTGFSSPSGGGGGTMSGSTVGGGAAQSGATDSQLNRLGASGSTDTNKLPGHEENAR